MNTPCGKQLPAQINQLANGPDYRFTGYENDVELNMLDAGARFYSSKLCQFTSTDPIDHPGVSTYGYANNNPTNLVDPDGRQAGGRLRVPMHQCSESCRSNLLEPLFFSPQTVAYTKMVNAFWRFVTHDMRFGDGSREQQIAIMNDQALSFGNPSAFFKQPAKNVAQKIILNLGDEGEILGAINLNISQIVTSKASVNFGEKIPHLIVGDVMHLPLKQQVADEIHMNFPDFMQGAWKAAFANKVKPMVADEMLKAIKPGGTIILTGYRPGNTMMVSADQLSEWFFSSLTTGSALPSQANMRRGMLHFITIDKAFEKFGSGVTFGITAEPKAYTGVGFVKTVINIPK